MSTVDLVCHSQGEHFENLMEIISYMARVSNPDNQNNKLTAPKLLAYLEKHNHFSPFEMVSATLEITTTRDIARQILRHRSFSFQEFSQRYAKVSSFSLREARLQDAKNRQNSLETKNSVLEEQWQEVQRNILDEVKAGYDWALNSGIAKEQARVILPEGLTESKMYMAGTIRSWMHYIALRTDASTQKEHREVAWQCAEALELIYPSILDFVVDN